MASQVRRARVVSESGTGGEWSDLPYLLDSDPDSEAWAQAPTKLLTLSDFGFSIPTSSDIRGIVVRILPRQSRDEIAFFELRLQTSSGTSGTRSDFSLFSFPLDLEFGGSSDLWDFSPSWSEINSSSFSVLVSVEGFGQEVFLGDLEVEVFYDPPVLVEGSDSGLVSGSEPVVRLWRILRGGAGDRGIVSSSETSDLEASLFPSEPGILLALESAGYGFDSDDEGSFFASEGALLWGGILGTEDPLVSGGEDWEIQAESSSSDPVSLASIEGPDLSALSESSDSGLFSLLSESGVPILDLLDLQTLSGSEEATNLLDLLDHLPIGHDELVDYLLRILEPRAWIELSYPKAILDIYEQERKVVERVFRGTETSVFLRFSSTTGRYYDPLSVRLLVRKPSGSLSLVPLTRIGSGTYRATVLFDEPGIWVLRGEGEEPLLAVTEERIEVIGDL